MHIEFINLIKNPTVIVVVVTWAIYRLGVWNERSNVLKSLESELAVWDLWLTTSWPKARNFELNDIHYFVYKIATTAVDNAIARGSTLLLNRDLINSLVACRQAVDNLNQLIDASRSFQSNIELWDKSNDENIKDRMLNLIKSIHSEGIGDNNKPAAHLAFSKLKKRMIPNLSQSFG